MCSGHVNVVMAFDKSYSLSGSVQCVFTAADSNVVTKTKFSMPGASLQDGSFAYSVGYATCSTAGLDKSAKGLQVTLVGSRTEVPAAHDNSWVPVETVPELTPEQQRQHASGKGPIAVCTAPLHEDGFAASMVEWAEFQQLVGVDKVFVYDFNSGPLLKPQLDYYARKGLFELFEWIIPSQIMHNPEQECLLPFFRPSANSVKFGAAECSMHQDNYQIPW